MAPLREPMRIQSMFHALAGYDLFIVAYCPTMFNAYANVGFLAMLGVSVISSVTYLLSSNVLMLTQLSATIITVIITMVAAVCFRLTARLFHRFNEYLTLALVMLTALSIALIVAYTFSNVIFNSELQIYSFANGLQLTSSSERLWLLADFVSDGQEKGTIVVLCACITIFTFFLLSAPFILIFHYRASIYYLTLKTYARNF
jgi:hypothetical protein